MHLAVFWANILIGASNAFLGIRSVSTPAIIYRGRIFERGHDLAATQPTTQMGNCAPCFFFFSPTFTQWTVVRLNRTRRFTQQWQQVNALGHVVLITQAGTMRCCNQISAYFQIWPTKQRGKNDLLFDMSMVWVTRENDRDGARMIESHEPTLLAVLETITKSSLLNCHTFCVSL